MFLDISIFFILGLLFGSFGNVVILRLPEAKSFVWGRSHCPKCQNTIRWWQNIPVISFLLLRGKCGFCQGKISIRYPIVELLMGCLFALVFYYYGWSWTTLEYLLFVFGLVVVSFIDLDHMILPDVFTLSGVVIGLSGAALNPERSFLDALLGVLIGGGLLWFVAALYYQLRKEDGLGGGDIKLLAWVGAVLGWSSVPFVVLIASLLGSFIGLSWAFMHNKGMRAAIPFGPYLSLGAIVYMLWGTQIGQMYIHWLVPRLASTN